MPSDAHPYLPVNHVFVDFENVKKVEVGEKLPETLPKATPPLERLGLFGEGGNP